MDTTHRSNGGMRLSNLNSHSSKMTANSTTVLPKRSPMKTASNKLSPTIRSPLGDLSSNSHSPKRSPKKETRRVARTTSIVTSPKKKEITVIPFSSTSTFVEEVAAAGIVESNTTQPKLIQSTSTTTAAVTTIIPLSDIVSESIEPSCCVDDDNWNHYQAISNYCFEKLSTIKNDCLATDEWLNRNAGMKEANQDNTTTSRVSNDMVIQMESLEATNAQLVNSLSTPNTNDKHTEKLQYGLGTYHLIINCTHG